MVTEVKGKYPRPMNVKFLEAPKINKPIWENLPTPARVKDSALQTIQRDFLTSGVPILKVMNKIFEAKDDLSSLDSKELLTTLKDSLLLLGSASGGMNKVRRDNLKVELPKNMQGLCRSDIQGSSTLLFGDNLNTTIKDISELNKLSQNFRPRGNFHRRGTQNRGGILRNFGQNSGRVVKRGRGKPRPFYKRFVQVSRRQNEDRRPLNAPGPSRL